MLANWVNSLKRLALEKHILLVCLDDESHRMACAQHVRTLRWNAEMLPSPQCGAAIYRKDGWKPIVFTKLVGVRELLQAGFQVIFSDLDVVFLRNPLPYFEHADFEFSFQSDAPAHLAGLAPEFLCSGFYHVRPTVNAIETLRFELEDYERWGGDQDFLRNRMTQNRLSTFRMLPRELFPNGALWQSAPPEEPFVVHFNWLIGVDAKVASMQESGLWLGP
jgi:hypothetical protein